MEGRQAILMRQTRCCRRCAQLIQDTVCTTISVGLWLFRNPLYTEKQQRESKVIKVLSVSIHQCIFKTSNFFRIQIATPLALELYVTMSCRIFFFFKLCLKPK